MLNQAIETETDHSWIPTASWHRLRLAQPRTFDRKNLLDQVPVMSATVLGLEILLHEPCIDLRMASELVLSDVGATLKILRLVGKEFEFATEHLGRMEDCLASLDAGTWFDAISARTFACDDEHAATSALWHHCRLVAQYAQLVAESLEGVSPEEAYLVGLLHEIGSIPNVLGWPNEDLRLEGSLPHFVVSAIRGLSDSSCFSVWKFILDAAHELAGTDSDCGSMHRPRPRLRRHRPQFSAVHRCCYCLCQCRLLISPVSHRLLICLTATVCDFHAPH